MLMFSVNKRQPRKNWKSHINVFAAFSTLTRWVVFCAPAILHKTSKTTFHKHNDAEKKKLAESKFQVIQKAYEGGINTVLRLTNLWRNMSDAIYAQSLEWPDKARHLWHIRWRRTEC